jgi:ribonuclease R
MADKVGDEFDGYITGVTAFGLFIELIEHFVEGLVHVSTMADDYYRFVERAHILHGENTGRVFRLGDRVTVQVIKVDMERRQIDLGLSEILDRVRMSERNRGPRVSKRDAQARKAGGKAGQSAPAAKGGRAATKSDKRRAQRPGRKERAARQGRSK